MQSALPNAGLAAVGWRSSRTHIIKARRIIGGASFGPEALKIVGQTFDEAWADIAGNFAEGAQTENAH
jgi:hypothetical protein